VQDSKQNIEWGKKKRCEAMKREFVDKKELDLDEQLDQEVKDLIEG